MPIPEPKPGEEKNKYLSSCIALLIDEGKEQDVAAAICYDKWEKRNEEKVNKYMKFYDFLEEEGIITTDIEKPLAMGSGESPSAAKKKKKVEEKTLSVPEKHQLKIAKDTLKMSGVGAKIMGGMSKEEARAFLKSIGWKDKKIKKLEEETSLNEVKNLDVIKMFINDNFPHDKEEAADMGIKKWKPEWGTPNLKISKQSNGWALVNYSTPILFRKNTGEVLFNTTKYSVTTSKIQTNIRDALKHANVKFKETDEAGIKKEIK